MYVYANDYRDMFVGMHEIKEKLKSILRFSHVLGNDLSKRNGKSSLLEPIHTQVPHTICLNGRCQWNEKPGRCDCTDHGQEWLHPLQDNTTEGECTNGLSFTK